MIEEYTGNLPSHVLAQLQEHSNGGFFLFRVGPNKDIIVDIAYDDEISFLSLVLKVKNVSGILEKIEKLKTFKDLAPSFLTPIEEENEEEDDETDID